MSTPTGKFGAVFGHGREAGARSDARSGLPSIPTWEPVAEARRARPGLAFACGADERLRLARDLHDGVQAELVSLLIRLKQAEEDPVTPPGLARTFAVLGDHTTAALASVRETALGIYPLALTRYGIVEALRTQAARASTPVTVSGAAPRSTDEADPAVYFSCSEAIQNVAEDAGQRAQATVDLDYHDGTLTARIEDNGRGFEPRRTPIGAGLESIRDRIETLGGSLELDSTPGRGTAMTVALPWPADGGERLIAQYRGEPVVRVVARGRTVTVTGGRGCAQHRSSVSDPAQPEEIRSPSPGYAVAKAERASE